MLFVLRKNELTMSNLSSQPWGVCLPEVNVKGAKNVPRLCCSVRPRKLREQEVLGRFFVPSGSGGRGRGPLDRWVGFAVREIGEV